MPMNWGRLEICPFYGCGLSFDSDSKMLAHVSFAHLSQLCPGPSYHKDAKAVHDMSPSVEPFDPTQRPLVCTPCSFTACGLSGGIRDRSYVAVYPDRSIYIASDGSSNFVLIPSDALLDVLLCKPSKSASSVSNLSDSEDLSVVLFASLSRPSLPALLPTPTLWRPSPLLITLSFPSHEALHNVLSTLLNMLVSDAPTSFQVSLLSTSHICSVIRRALVRKSLLQHHWPDDPNMLSSLLTHQFAHSPIIKPHFAQESIFSSEVSSCCAMHACAKGNYEREITSSPLVALMGHAPQLWGHENSSVNNSDNKDDAFECGNLEPQLEQEEEEEEEEKEAKQIQEEQNVSDPNDGSSGGVVVQVDHVKEDFATPAEPVFKKKRYESFQNQQHEEQQQQGDDINNNSPIRVFDHRLTWVASDPLVDDNVVPLGATLEQGYSRLVFPEPEVTHLPGHKPKTGYQLFHKIRVAELKNENPNMKHQEAFRRAAQDWSKMDEKTKTFWKDRADLKPLQFKTVQERAIHFQTKRKGKLYEEDKE